MLHSLFSFSCGQRDSILCCNVHSSWSHTDVGPHPSSAINQLWDLGKSPSLQLSLLIHKMVWKKWLLHQSYCNECIEGTYQQLSPYQAPHKNRSPFLFFILPLRFESDSVLVTFSGTNGILCPPPLGSLLLLNYPTPISQLPYSITSQFSL